MTIIMQKDATENDIKKEVELIEAKGHRAQISKGQARTDRKQQIGPERLYEIVKGFKMQERAI